LIINLNEMKKRLSHIGSILIFTPFIFGIEFILYTLVGSKTKPKDQIKFIWDSMWEPLDREPESNVISNNAS